MVIGSKEKTKGRTILHCAIYPNSSILNCLMNCSASGKRKGGDCYVRMALGQRGFTVLLRPLFFLYLFESFSINLLNCKHRTGFALGGVTCKLGALCSETRLSVSCKTLYVTLV